VLLVVLICAYTYNPGEPDQSKVTVAESKVLRMAGKGATCDAGKPSSVKRVNGTHFEYMYALGWVVAPAGREQGRGGGGGPRVLPAKFPLPSPATPSAGVPRSH
jgi:hypothetical protein